MLKLKFRPLIGGTPPLVTFAEWPQFRKDCSSPKLPICEQLLYSHFRFTRFWRLVENFAPVCLYRYGALSRFFTKAIALGTGQYLWEYGTGK